MSTVANSNNSLCIHNCCSDTLLHAVCDKLKLSLFYVRNGYFEFMNAEASTSTAGLDISPIKKIPEER